jgi:hypothetical protein
MLFIVNYTYKLIANTKHTPLAYLALFIFSGIGQACSPFAGAVDEKNSDSYYYSSSKKEIRYSPMGNWFELGNTKLEADVNSFTVMAREFGKDKDHLFYKYHIIDSEVDIASFSIKDPLCFDKIHVYVPYEYTFYSFRESVHEENHLMLIEGANPNTYETLKDNWSKDDQHYFYYYQQVPVDYQTFEPINPLFAKDKNKVYLLKTFSLIESSIDANTAKSLDDRYIVDKDNVYDFQEYHDGEQVDSLISIRYKDIDRIKIIEKEYLIVDDRAFYDGFEIDGVDVASFKAMGSSYYAIDKNQAYYLGKVIKGADPTTFSVFEYVHYSKDKAHVYGNGVVIEEADVKTFGPVDDKYSLLYKDKNHVFRGNEIVED